MDMLFMVGEDEQGKAVHISTRLRLMLKSKQGVLLCLVASASGVDHPVTSFSVPDAAVPHVFIDNERSGQLIIRYQHASRRI